jgi:HEAT repeat protein
MDLPKTLEHLQSDEPLLSAALYNLSKIDPEEVEQVIAIWPLLQVERRRAMVKELVDISEDNFEVDFEPVFRWGLTDSDATVRATCVEGLWENEDLRLMDELLNLLTGDLSIQVRAAAAQSLGRFLLLCELGKVNFERCRPVYETLFEIIALEAEDIDVRRRAIESVAYVGNDEVVALLEDAYCHSDEKMRVSAIFGMGRSADARWIDIVVQELYSTNPEMRYEAARACGELEARAAVPRLATLVNDPDREVRESAVWALGQAGGDTARRILLTCCEDGDEAIRDAAAAALEELEFMYSQLDFPFHSVDDAEDDLLQ